MLPGICRKYGDGAALRVYEEAQRDGGLVGMRLRIVHRLMMEWDHINVLRKKRLWQLEEAKKTDDLSAEGVHAEFMRSFAEKCRRDAAMLQEAIDGHIKRCGEPPI